jgi:predicted CoA-binding protein
VPGSETDDLVREILTSARLIAMIGASADPMRDSYDVMRFLLRQGYRSHSGEPDLAGESILGQQVARLADIDEPVDLVDVFRNSAAAAGVVVTRSRLARAVWMQLGVVNEAAAIERARAGLKVVMDRCPRSRCRGWESQAGLPGSNERRSDSREGVHCARDYGPMIEQEINA